MSETYATFKIVSPRFVQLLQELEATGWSTLSVEITGAEGEAIEGLSLLVVTGRAGPIDRRRTRIVRVDPPVPAGAPTYSERGLFFEPSSWDGSDLFVPADTAVVAVRHRIKAAVEDRKLTNIRFIPLTEYELMLYSEYPAHRRG